MFDKVIIHLKIIFKKFLKLMLTAILIAIILFSIVYFTKVIISDRDKTALELEVISLEKELAKIDGKNSKIRKALNGLQTDNISIDFLEEKLREVLNYSYPNEITIIMD